MELRQEEAQEPPRILPNRKMRRRTLALVRRLRRRYARLAAKHPDLLEEVLENTMSEETDGRISDASQAGGEG